MKELSLHLLDLAQNSLSAGATLVELALEPKDGFLHITLRDNGRGMTPEFLASVTDPFTTTRKTRRVGLGLPLYRAAAEQTGGDFSIESAVGVGTVVSASFAIGHLDTPPVGDLPGTVVALIQGAPEVDFVFRTGDETLDTRALRETLEDVPLNSPDVLAWILEAAGELMNEL